MTINPLTPKKVKTNQTVSCKMTAGRNEKELVNSVTFNIINPINNSKFKVVKQQRIAPSIAYLFLLKYPVKITQKLNKIENNDAYTKLYSISNNDKLGPQTEFIQRE